MKPAGTRRLRARTNERGEAQDRRKAMTTKEQVEAMWKILREDFGIETMEQFQREYDKLPGIDITAFVDPLDHSVSQHPKG